MGVRRALSLCMNLVSTKCSPLFTLGPIIHNDIVIKELAALGVKHVKADDSFPKNSYVLIRSHGVSPQKLEELKSKIENVCDATCPKVAKVQGIVKGYVKKGFKIVIIGDHGHAETEGLMGYTENNGYIVANRKEAEELILELSKDSRLCVVAQTTQELQLFDELCGLFNSSVFAEVKVINTICDATMKRQAEVGKLSPHYDVIIVVGGSNSANTKRLYEIAKSVGKRAYFVEKTGDIPFKEIKDNDSVLITAGASTPLWLIHDIKTELLKKNFLYKFLSVLSSGLAYWVLSGFLFLLSALLRDPWLAVLTLFVMLINKGLTIIYMKRLDFLIINIEKWQALIIACFSVLLFSVFFESKILLLIFYYSIMLYMVYKYKVVSREVVCSFLNGVFLIIPFII